MSCMKYCTNTVHETRPSGGVGLVLSRVRAQSTQNYSKSDVKPRADGLLRASSMTGERGVPSATRNSGEIFIDIRPFDRDRECLGADADSVAREDRVSAVELPCDDCEADWLLRLPIGRRPDSERRQYTRCITPIPARMTTSNSAALMEGSSKISVSPRKKLNTLRVVLQNPAMATTIIQSARSRKRRTRTLR